MNRGEISNVNSKLSKDVDIYIKLIRIFGRWARLDFETSFDEEKKDLTVKLLRDTFRIILHPDWLKYYKGLKQHALQILKKARESICKHGCSNLIPINCYAILAAPWTYRELKAIVNVPVSQEDALRFCNNEGPVILLLRLHYFLQDATLVSLAHRLAAACVDASRSEDPSFRNSCSEEELLIFEDVLLLLISDLDEDRLYSEFTSKPVEIILVVVLRLIKRFQSSIEHLNCDKSSQVDVIQSFSSFWLQNWNRLVRVIEYFLGRALIEEEAHPDLSEIVSMFTWSHVRSGLSGAEIVDRLSSFVDIYGKETDHVYAICDGMYQGAGISVRGFVLKHYIIAMTADINRHRDLEESEDTNAKLRQEAKLYKLFLNLSNIVRDQKPIFEMCVRAAFLLNPTEDLLELLYLFKNKKRIKICKCSDKQFISIGPRSEDADICENISEVNDSSVAAREESPKESLGDKNCDNVSITEVSNEINLFIEVPEHSSEGTLMPTSSCAEEAKNLQEESMISARLWAEDDRISKRSQADEGAMSGGSQAEGSGKSLSPQGAENGILVSSPEEESAIMTSYRAETDLLATSSQTKEIAQNGTLTENVIPGSLIMANEHSRYFCPSCNTKCKIHTCSQLHLHDSRECDCYFKPVSLNNETIGKSNSTSSTKASISTVFAETFVNETKDPSESHEKSAESTEVPLPKEDKSNSLVSGTRDMSESTEDSLKQPRTERPREDVPGILDTLHSNGTPPVDFVTLKHTLSESNENEKEITSHSPSLERRVDQIISSMKSYDLDVSYYSEILGIPEVTMESLCILLEYSNRYNFDCDPHLVLQKCEEYYCDPETFKNWVKELNFRQIRRERMVCFDDSNVPIYAGIEEGYEKYLIDYVGPDKVLTGTAESEGLISTFQGTSDSKKIAKKRKTPKKKEAFTTRVVKSKDESCCEKKTKNPTKKNKSSKASNILDPLSDPSSSAKKAINAKSKMLESQHEIKKGDEGLFFVKDEYLTNNLQSNSFVKPSSFKKNSVNSQNSCKQKSDQLSQFDDEKYLKPENVRSSHVEECLGVGKPFMDLSASSKEVESGRGVKRKKRTKKCRVCPSHLDNDTENEGIVDSLLPFHSACERNTELFVPKVKNRAKIRSNQFTEALENSCVDHNDSCSRKAPDLNEENCLERNSSEPKAFVLRTSTRLATTKEKFTCKSANNHCIDFGTCFCLEPKLVLQRTPVKSDENRNDVQLKGDIALKEDAMSNKKPNFVFKKMKKSLILDISGEMSSVSRWSDIPRSLKKQKKIKSKSETSSFSSSGQCLTLEEEFAADFVDIKAESKRAKLKTGPEKNHRISEEQKDEKFFANKLDIQEKLQKGKSKIATGKICRKSEEQLIEISSMKAVSKNEKSRTTIDNPNRNLEIPIEEELAIFDVKVGNTEEKSKTTIDKLCRNLEKSIEEDFVNIFDMKVENINEKFKTTKGKLCNKSEKIIGYYEETKQKGKGLPICSNFQASFEEKISHSSESLSLIQARLNLKQSKDQKATKEVLRLSPSLDSLEQKITKQEYQTERDTMLTVPRSSVLLSDLFHPRYMKPLPQDHIVNMVQIPREASAATSNALSSQNTPASPAEIQLSVPQSVRLSQNRPIGLQQVRAVVTATTNRKVDRLSPVYQNANEASVPVIHSPSMSRNQNVIRSNIEDNGQYRNIDTRPSTSQSLSSVGNSASPASHEKRDSAGALNLANNHSILTQVTYSFSGSKPVEAHRSNPDSFRVLAVPKTGTRQNSKLKQMPREKQESLGSMSDSTVIKYPSDSVECLEKPSPHAVNPSLKDPNEVPTISSSSDKSHKNSTLNLHSSTVNDSNSKMGNHVSRLTVAPSNVNKFITAVKSSPSQRHSRQDSFVLKQAISLAKKLDSEPKSTSSGKDAKRSQTGDVLEEFEQRKNEHVNQQNLLPKFNQVFGKKSGFESPSSPSSSESVLASNQSLPSVDTFFRAVKYTSAPTVQKVVVNVPLLRANHCSDSPVSVAQSGIKNEPNSCATEETSLCRSDSITLPVLSAVKLRGEDLNLDPFSEQLKEFETVYEMVANGSSTLPLSQNNCRELEPSCSQPPQQFDNLDYTDYSSAESFTSNVSMSLSNHAHSALDNPVLSLSKTPEDQRSDSSLTEIKVESASPSPVLVRERNLQSRYVILPGVSGLASVFAIQQGMQKSGIVSKLSPDLQRIPSGQITPKSEKRCKSKSPVKANVGAAVPVRVSTGVSPQKTQPKPADDHDTVLRVQQILEEYTAQVQKSPDLVNKPAPRRRSNPPPSPNQSTKRRKQSPTKVKLMSEQSKQSESESSRPGTACGMDSQPKTIIDLTETSPIPPENEEPPVATASSQFHVMKPLIVTNGHPGGVRMLLDPSTLASMSGKNQRFLLSPVKGLKMLTLRGQQGVVGLPFSGQTFQIRLCQPTTTKSESVPNSTDPNEAHQLPEGVLPDVDAFLAEGKSSEVVKNEVFVGFEDMINYQLAESRFQSVSPQPEMKPTLVMGPDGEMKAVQPHSQVLHAFNNHGKYEQLTLFRGEEDDNASESKRVKLELSNS
ncbi:uncharacterized protein LOC136035442 [Artemia franciscana]|uniref:Uncharacterized protein n=1 Tax=Artemia franciscana TaxID=6661 RepID=A0AA88I4L8_ARTSF|nr:hypothetical protein QYM36_003897 [Artemia franciscana]